tara:strand:+ start:355 stop:684 length:330 start_codon:yes stop_codon:yes gene_type:complete
MTPLEKLEQHLNVSITNFDTLGMIDLQLTEYLTADDYGIYILTENPQQINWENDVYYYKPDFNTIMERIVEVAENIPKAKIYIDDIEEHLEDYQIEQWLNDNIDDDGTE